MVRVSYCYESASDQLAALDTRQVIKGGILGDTLSSDKPSDSGYGERGWSGTGTNCYQDAVRLATEGDQDTARKINPRAVDLITHGNLNTLVHDVQGDTPNVPLFLSGNPENMMSVRKRGKPTINILVNATAHCGVKHHVIEARGKAILEIMSGLEANGYGVDITTICRVGGGYGGQGIDYSVSCRVKSSGEYFNLPSLAYWLVNASVLRRLFFRHQEQETVENQKLLGSGYGYPMNVPQNELDQMPDCVYFPILTGNDTEGYKQAIEQVMNTYRA